MLTNEQNLWFMNHPDLKAAQEKVKAAKERIRGIQMLNSAQTILRMMYPAMKELDTAYNEQLAVEARLMYEISEREKEAQA